MKIHTTFFSSQKSILVKISTPEFVIRFSVFIYLCFIYFSNRSPRNTPRDLLTSERLSRLSPAAQKLVKSNIRLNSDSSLRASYSPSPHHAKRTPSTPGGLVKTPSSRTKTPGSVRNDASSITDNLLQLPNTWWDWCSVYTTGRGCGFHCFFKITEPQRTDS